MLFLKNIAPIHKSITCTFNTIIKIINRVPFKLIIYIITNSLFYILWQ